MFFFKKVREALGLDRCHFPMTGAAPTNEDTLSYFMSVDIPLHELYGMSETSGMLVEFVNAAQWLIVYCCTYNLIPGFV